MTTQTFAPRPIIAARRQTGNPWVNSIYSLVSRWLQYRRYRKQYLELYHSSDAILADIGVTRDQLRAEILKPFRSS